MMPFNMDAIDQQVMDLKQRMETLQRDRSAKIDDIDNKKSDNENKISVMRESNKALRHQLSNFKNEEKISAVDSHSVHGLKRHVIKAKTEFDKLKVNISELSKKRSKLLGTLEAYAVETPQESKRGTMIDNTMKELENKLDQGLKKCNEATQIKTSFQQILDCRKGEKVLFDHELKEKNKIVESKDKDYKDLMVLFSETKKATGFEQSKLAKACNLYNKSQKQRKRQKNEKERMMKFYQKLIKQQEGAEEERQTHIRKVKEAKSTDKEQEDRLAAGLEPTSEKVEYLTAQQEKCCKLEGLFSNIMKVTELVEPVQIIEKVREKALSNESRRETFEKNQNKIIELHVNKENCMLNIYKSKFDNEDNPAPQQQNQSLQKPKVNDVPQQVKYCIGSIQQKMKQCSEGIHKYHSLNLQLESSMEALQATLKSVQKYNGTSNNRNEEDRCVMGLVDNFKNMWPIIQMLYDDWKKSNIKDSNMLAHPVGENSEIMPPTDELEGYLTSLHDIRVNLPSFHEITNEDVLKSNDQSDSDEDEEEELSRDQIKKIAAHQKIERERERELRQNDEKTRSIF
jgi:hypothetical protein